MYKFLNKINNPKDLKKLKLKEEDKKILAEEIREFILENVSKTGGHLASSLGAVELTIALHEVFDTPKDKIIWDVGHQTYAHKILTGRKDKFSSLRQLNGISGFPKRLESQYDSFDTGHSSTSISAALGMARSRDLKGEKYKVIAVIGDGALTGGMALEALADSGVSKKDLIIILNDNQMSIERNKGGLARALTKMRIRKSYSNSNRVVKNLVLKIPRFGKWITKKIRKTKLRIKLFLMPNMMFEQMGFKYLGPVNGNDIESLENILNSAKEISGPILIHCKTVKGKGYKFAEENPDKFHGTSSFDINTGKTLKEKKKDYSAEFGETLINIASKNKDVVAITAAMASGTGLSKFKEIYPDRFFDVEIAEQHALTMAAGMASSGSIPVVAMYSSFLQRAYDQVIHDICMQNLHVVIGIDRAGIVGADGETHQGLLDLAFLRNVPNMTICSPKDFNELDQMLEFAINDFNGPISIRYPRGEDAKINFNIKNKENNKIVLGRAETILEGNKLTIVAIGKMVEKAYEIAQMLREEKNIDAKVINARFLKPFDENIIIKDKNKKIYTIEDGTIKGGLYSEIAEIITKNKLKKDLKGFGYNDEFIRQGTIEELEKENKLDSVSIYKEIVKDFNVNNKKIKKQVINKVIRLDKISSK